MERTKRLVTRRLLLHAMPMKALIFNYHDLILSSWVDRGWLITCSKWNKFIWRLVTGRFV